MKEISLFSVPGIIGLLALIMLVIPDNWGAEVLQVIGYDSKLTVVYGLMAFLLIYTVLVKNKMTFDEIGFILLSAFYVGIRISLFNRNTFCRT